MFKKLDKLILKSFLGPFIATFFIAVFVLMMQILWKYIDDLVGKGLDFITIGKFLWYASAALLTLAMPIAILISSIMTFGNLGESFELVAIKSAGISLLRFMRPLMFVSLILCFITFLFANYVIPYSQLKFVTLYNDIYYKKPAFALKEGVFFTQIPGVVIKVGAKGEGDSIIKDVLVYEQGNPLQDNAINAKSGLMRTKPGSTYLEFNLKDGHRYQENGQMGDSSTEFIRVGFKEFSKLFDLSGLKLQTTSDSVFKNNSKMLSARQLTKNADSLKRMQDTTVLKGAEVVKTYTHYLNVKQKVIDSATQVKYSVVIPDSVARFVKDRTYNVLNDMKSALEFPAAEMKDRAKELRYTEIELQKKYALSLSCLVLFFIGAPLGSIIRKGGLGMPLVIAIVFFLLFHLLNMFGEKFVKEGVLPASIGIWLAVLVLSPIGFFFTYKAMNDSQLFNKEQYTKAFNAFKGIFIRKKI